MRIIIACEYSGIVRRAFAAKGHEVYSCDLLPSEDDSPKHIIGDIKNVLKCAPKDIDMMIAHPPCTYLAVSGLHWNKRVAERAAKTEEALEFVKFLMGADIPKICIENPVSCISSRIRKPEQIIQPWMFGHDASKKTCLWLKNLPPLVPTNIIKKERYANQTPTGQNNLGPSADRWKERSRTYQGIADAMAAQWG